MGKPALIAGIIRQDGAYLLEFLLGKRYVEHGIERRASQFNTQRIGHLYQDPHEPESRLVLPVLCSHYDNFYDEPYWSIVKALRRADRRYGFSVKVLSCQQKILA